VPGKLLSIREICDEYGLSDKTVRRKIKNGDLAAYRCGARLLKLDAEQVEAALMRPVGAADRDWAYEQLAAHAAKVVADWPKPSDEQLAKVAAILRLGGDPVGRKAVVDARIAELDSGGAA
jgi:excisionase family DNA binding protein